jgi:hypothetical protein
LAAGIRDPAVNLCQPPPCFTSHSFTRCEASKLDAPFVQSLEEPSKISSSGVSSGRFDSSWFELSLVGDANSFKDLEAIRPLEFPWESHGN